MTEGFENPGMTSFLTGVDLAVNAISDAFLVVDGPPCTFFRASQIQGNHDWQSTLVTSTGHHRVSHTDCTPDRAALGDEQTLVNHLKKVDVLEQCGLILWTAMSMVSVTGRQYEKLHAKLLGELSKPLVWIRPGSMEGDWLHGYASTLEALARSLRQPKKTKHKGARVAIVGYLMDRNEADHQANLAELKRLIEGLGLELCCVWLDGGPAGSLERFIEAGTILSFPYGREAAQFLAERTGANLVECQLPLGLQATGEWLRKVGAATGCEKQADELIDAELKHAVPRLKWILQHSLLDKGLALIGDPHLVEALASMAGELGCRVELRAHMSDRSVAAAASGEGILLKHPGEKELERAVLELREQGALNLVITNSQALVMLSRLPGPKLPFMELGFASYHTHALYDSPYLGFRGTLRLVERMANTMSQAAAFYL